MLYTPESELLNRIGKIQALISQASLDGVLVVHHTNLFYYSGTSQDAYLYIPRSGEPLLMVKKCYDRASSESKLGNIRHINSVKELLPLIQSFSDATPATVGIELDVMPVNTFRFYQSRVFSGVRLEDGSSLLKKVRLIKSDYEIDLLKKSCKVLDSAFEQIPLLFTEGMREIELASQFEAHLRNNGLGGGCKVRGFNKDFLFGNLVSGTNATASSYFDGPVNGVGVTPANNPHGAGWKRICKNEPIYIDYTCVVNGYTADAERIFVSGRLDDALVNAHQVALQIQDEVIGALDQGATCEDAWVLANTIADKKGLIGHFMGIGSDRVKFLGHGVGLELDEFPIFAKGFEINLEKGMTFALEPKFVFEQGAVGIENTFAVTSSGIEKLTKFGEEICYI